MSFEADLKAHLQADATIVALVSTRIHPLILPERSAYPAIAYSRVSSVPQNDLDGLDGNLTDIRVQVNVWARDFDAARQVAEAVRTRMKTSAATFAAVMISDNDTFDPAVDVAGVQMDFSCWYSTA